MKSVNVSYYFLKLLNSEAPADLRALYGYQVCFLNLVKVVSVCFGWISQKEYGISKVDNRTYFLALPASVFI